MICLSRSDKNLFKVDERIKERTNYNSLNISHGTLYCNGGGQTYELEDLCKFIKEVLGDSGELGL